MKPFLFLASQSRSRIKLLESTEMPFECFSHNSDEVVEVDSFLRDGAKYVEYVATLKYSSLNFDKLFQRAFEKKLDSFAVLVCDTVNQTESGEIMLKPVDEKDILRHHDLLNNKTTSVYSSFILSLFVFENSGFIEKNRIQETIKTDICISISKEDSLKYIEKHRDFLLCITGGFSAEGYGMQFVQSINGNYSSLLGLPLDRVVELMKRN